MKKKLMLLAICMTLMMLGTACGSTEQGDEKTSDKIEANDANDNIDVNGNGVDGNTDVIDNHDYGVFLGAEPEDTEKMKQYKTIVIEGQAFTKEQVDALKNEGHIVYSYINVGAIENYRSYYKEYEKYTLDVYKNWEDERWVDVAQPEWQSFIIDLAGELKDKDFDGLFVDNLDVYYHYKSDAKFDAITKILKAFKDYGFYVSINGGDVYVTECFNRFDAVNDIFDAVNQETVFSSINWDKKDSFGTQKKSETEYFTEYLDEVSRHGVDVYLLEYTTDAELNKKIESFCNEKGYRYYVSPKLNLE